MFEYEDSEHAISEKWIDYGLAETGSTASGCDKSLSVCLINLYEKK